METNYEELWTEFKQYIASYKDKHESSILKMSDSRSVRTL